MNHTAISQFVEKIRMVSPVDEVIGQHVELRERGNELVGRCPFHEDSTPSFYVNPARGLYNCFGCDAEGDVFTFIMRREQTEFWAAVVHLAGRAGIPLPDQDPAAVRRYQALAEERRALEDLLDEAVALYQRQLNSEENSGPLTYLRKRALTDKTIKAARIGFAPATGWWLWCAMNGLGYTETQLLKTGLFVRTSQGIRDFFCGRVVFPYLAGGRPVYLIGRQTQWTPDAEWERAKYKKQLTHSDKHPYVSEAITNRYLYGVDTIHRGQPALITEGIVDAIMAHQAGLPCVSPVTVRFAKDDYPAILQAVRQASAVYICNDNEENQQGARGAEDTAEFLAAHNVPCKLVTLPRPEGVAKVDLADYLMGHTAENLQPLLEAAQTVYEVRLERAEVPRIEHERLPAARDFVTKALANWPDEFAVSGFIEGAVVPRFELAKASVQGLRRAWRERRTEQEAKEKARAQPVRRGRAAGPDQRTDKPAVNAGNGDLAELITQTWAAVRRQNDPPLVFQRSGGTVWIRTGDHGHPYPAEVPEAGLRGLLAEWIDWYRPTEKGDPRIVHPPTVAVQGLLTDRNPPLPTLMRIVEAPVYGAQGELQTDPGYHPASRTYYWDSGVRLPAVPAAPTTDDVARARELLLNELLLDFPFVTDSDRAHTLAALLLPFVREMVDGATPLHLIEAPSPGSGKSLLADAIAIPATGRPAAAMAEGREEDEWRKRLTAVLLEAPTYLLIDNVRRKLDSAALAAAITSQTWKDRLLGRSQTVEVPTRCVWLATGNNSALTTEMARRCVRIRLDPKMARPWQRSGFKHEDLRTWARANRADLVWAALTLVQHWIARGRPPGQYRLGQFEAWATTLGGILDAAGVPGFLANLDELYDEADEETAEWEEFLRAWYAEHQGLPQGVRELYRIAEDRELLLVVRGDGGDRSQRIRFGKALAQQRDRRLGRYQVTRAGMDGRGGTATYSLADAEEAPF